MPHTGIETRLHTSPWSSSGPLTAAQRSGTGLLRCVQGCAVCSSLQRPPPAPACAGCCCATLHHPTWAPHAPTLSHTQRAHRHYTLVYSPRQHPRFPPRFRCPAAAASRLLQVRQQVAANQGSHAASAQGSSTHGLQCQLGGGLIGCEVHHGTGTSHQQQAQGGQQPRGVPVGWCGGVGSGQV